MTNEALGIIDTRGYIPLVEAADAMVKAADVYVLGYERLKGGHVTVLIRGDVAAVKAAIDVGVIAAKQVGEFVASNVIPRPHFQTEAILPPKKKGGFQ